METDMNVQTLCDYKQVISNFKQVFVVLGVFTSSVQLRLGIYGINFYEYLWV